MRVVAKIGGAQLEQPGPRAELARAVAAARARGCEVVLVHGGGNQIRSWAERLGLPQQYCDGLRVTDAATAEVVVAVLAGLVNKHLVAALEAAGVRAAGLCGADGSTLRAAVHAPGGRDLGYVGRVESVDPRLVEGLLAADIVPVLATVAPLAPRAAASAHGERGGQLYNINADMAAGPLARALAADALLLLTDVPGVLDERRCLLPQLDAAACTAMLRSGVIAGGMRPKVEAALAALAAIAAPGATAAAGPAWVAIAPAAGESSLCNALDGRSGTRLVAGTAGGASAGQAVGSEPAAPRSGCVAIPVRGASETEGAPSRLDGGGQSAAASQGGGGLDGAGPAPSRGHVMATYAPAPEVFVDGQGAVLRDAEGREYLDFLSGIAVSALGHGHPELVAALREQAGALLHVSNLYRHPHAEAVATRLAELTGLQAVFFCNSGAEANEAALKIARKHQRRRGAPERTGFVALEGSFHGRTLGALSVTHNAAYREPFAPLVPGAVFAPFGDADALEAALRSTRPAALLLEPIQGESGIRALPAPYLRAARQLCDDTGTVLIHDEVQCGCGRTGTFLAADIAGVRPDIATLAKPLAGGLPMGAAVVSADLADALVPGDHGSTFAGGPLVCRAALVLLDALAGGGLQEQVRARGAQLRAGLLELAARHPVIAEVRGRGLMLGLRLHRGAPALQRALHQRRMLTNCTAGDVVRFLPPYVISEAQVADGLARLADALAELQAAPDSGARPAGEAGAELATRQPGGAAGGPAGERGGDPASEGARVRRAPLSHPGPACGGAIHRATAAPVAPRRRGRDDTGMTSTGMTAPA